MRFFPFPWLAVFGMAMAVPALAQETAYPEVEKFAASIKGTLWELRGTNTLKRLRYDGEAFAPVGRNGQSGKRFETAFVDVGVVRLNFTEQTSGWYFFSDDLKYVTPATVSAELAFQLSPQATPKPVQAFPADVTGQVWDLVTEGQSLPQGRCRWTGRELELGTLQQDGKWKVDRYVPVVAGRRVFEINQPGRLPSWMVFSADGKEAWLLDVVNAFGGHSAEVPQKAARTPAETGLTGQLTDLVNFAEDLMQVPAEKERLETLRRQVQRSLAKEPEKAKLTLERLGGK